MNALVTIQCPKCSAHISRYLSGSFRQFKCECGFSVSANATEGFIYVLSNPSLGISIYKIGYTERSIEERLEELNSQTAIPRQFVIEALFPSASPRDHECAIHQRLDRYRHGKEFFRAPIATIYEAIATACKTKCVVGRHMPKPSAKPISTIFQLKKCLSMYEAKRNYQKCMVLCRNFCRQYPGDSGFSEAAKLAKRYERIIDSRY